MKGNSMKKGFLWMVLTTLAAEAAIAIPIAFAFAVTVFGKKRVSRRWICP
jgi:hypothetical protein